MYDLVGIDKKNPHKIILYWSNSKPNLQPSLHTFTHMHENVCAHMSKINV